jgi:hypothetical protein
MTVKGFRWPPRSTSPRDPLTQVVLDRMLAGVSTRLFVTVGEPDGQMSLTICPTMSVTGYVVGSGKRGRSQTTTVKRAGGSSSWQRDSSAPGPMRRARCVKGSRRHSL